jgi:hypothetical protein
MKVLAATTDIILQHLAKLPVGQARDLADGCTPLNSARWRLEGTELTLIDLAEIDDQYVFEVVWGAYRFYFIAKCESEILDRINVALILNL